MNSVLAEAEIVAPTGHPTSPDEWISLTERSNLIGGQLLRIDSGLTVLNPATGSILATAAASGSAEVDQAVATAKVAQVAWAATPARQRGKLVAAAGRALGVEAEVVARLLAAETGKAIRTECRGELAAAADMLEFYGGIGSELKGETVPFHPETLTVTTREPLGVVGAILPWNVPLLLMMLKCAPALVAGNTVVVKAAEEAPLATLAAGIILNRYLPAGVLNVVCGDGPSCGAELVAHPDVAKITFTGSEEVGLAVYRGAADKIIPVSLELGGKSPMLVCADAGLEAAISGAISGMRFTRQGQSCTASSRIYVHESLFDAFVQGLRDRLDAMVIGDPMDETTDIGSIVSSGQAERIRGFVDLARATPGATVIECGRLELGPALDSSLFLRPTIVLGLDEKSPVVQEEIFGPVVTIAPWHDYDAVIAAANSTRYGLAATIWTRDLGIALDASRRLDAGYVQVNQNLTIQPNLSYGGFRRSGIGKEASLEAMLEHFTRKKTIVFAAGVGGVGR